MRQSKTSAYVWAFLALVALNVAYRFPPLLNAAGMNSDIAIVGLQAMHMLQGEVSRFLWGAGYQGSFDAMVVAAFFYFGGPTPLMLMLAPFLGHLILAFCAFAVTARYVSAGRAFLLGLPLVFTPIAINGVALGAPRQWCITFLFLGAFLIDGATQKKKAPLFLGVGAFLGFLATFFDLYGLQLLGPLLVFMLIVCFDSPFAWKRLGLRALGGAAGSVAGYFTVQLLRQADGASNSQASLSFSMAHVTQNFELLKETCLPWVLGGRSFVPGANLYPDAWDPPAPVRWFQMFGAGTLLVFIALALVLVFVRRVPWGARRVGLFGLGATTASILGFLVSGMPSDMWSARYLAPIVWTAPFALLPLVAALRTQGAAVLLMPYLSVAALSGWLSFGADVKGPIPVSSPRGSAKDELAVCEYLKNRHIEYGAAQYWLSYRLTFLCQEHPIIVPLEPGQDRYPPYREAMSRSPVLAFIFHPSEPRATPDMVLPSLQQAGGTVEVQNISGFTVVIHDRSVAR